MAITKTTFLYEILVRFGPDGYRGSHVLDLEKVVDGAEILVERVLPARPITEAEVGELLGGKVAALIEQLDAANARIAELETPVSELEEEEEDEEDPEPESDPA